MKVHHLIYKIETLFTIGILAAAIGITLWIIYRNLSSKTN